jgi:hypothetical protein
LERTYVKSVQKVAAKLQLALTRCTQANLLPEPYNPLQLAFICGGALCEVAWRVGENSMRLAIKGNKDMDTSGN